MHANATQARWLVGNGRSSRAAGCGTLYAMVFASLSASAAMAQDDGLRVVRGLPQATLHGGQAVALRYVTVRGPSAPIGIEVRLPECVESLPAWVRARSDAEPAGGCFAGGTAGGAGLGTEHVRLASQQRVAGMFDAQMAVRAWHSRSGYDTARRDGRGVDAEVEIGRSAGPLYGFVGHSEPLASDVRSAAWRTSYAGFEWHLADVATVEWVFDAATSLADGARDRRVSLAYLTDVPGGARLRLEITRLVDAPFEGWRSGLGVEWSF